MKACAFVATSATHRCVGPRRFDSRKSTFLRTICKRQVSDMLTHSSALISCPPRASSKSRVRNAAPLCRVRGFSRVSPRTDWVIFQHAHRRRRARSRELVEEAGHGHRDKAHRDDAGFDCPRRCVSIIHQTCVGTKIIPFLAMTARQRCGGWFRAEWPPESFKFQDEVAVELTSRINMEMPKFSRTRTLVTTSLRISRVGDAISGNVIEDSTCYLRNTPERSEG